MKQLLTLLAFQLVLTSTLFSQDIGIGEWRDHLPYNSTISVTSGNGLVYCATPYSLFYFDKADNTLTKLTKISGLSDIGISRIAFNDAENTLVIGYKNTNLDFIKGYDIINISDIYNSEAIPPGEKELYNIRFISNKAYVCCGYGITVINIDDEEVSDTYYIGPNGSHLTVYDLTYNDTSFFAATEDGIYTADIDNPNLAYFESWTKDTSVPFPNAAYNHIQVNDGYVYTNKYDPAWGKDTIIYFDGSQWNYNMEAFSSSDVFSLKSIDDILYVSYRYAVKTYKNDAQLITSIWTYGNDINPNARDVTVTGGQLWIADAQNGLVRQNDTYDYTFMYPNGPKTISVFATSAEGGAVWTVPGGRGPSWENTWKRASASSFISNEWETYDRFNTPAFDTILDMLSVCVNPANPDNVFTGSWNRGLCEFMNNELVRVYNTSNSSLQYNMIEGAPVIKVGGIAFDENNNLWVTNSGADNVLSVRMPGSSPEGSWRSFYVGSGSSGKDIGGLLIDSYGQKWMLMRETSSLLVFNDNGTITDPTDDKYKKLSSSTGNGGLPGNKVYSFANDLDGEVWIGTDEGPAVFYSPENVFSNYNFDAQQILIPRNDGTNNADILLVTETITAIAIDGANNKWIGTDRSGVYELSPDGQKEIHHFTAENSPLFSNNISSISIDQQSGEVFIGTSKGLISYKSTSTGGGTVNSDVYAYPNPVRPGYTGPIAIKGLVSNADFKITDINGNLIYSGTAEGGQAIWDGNNFDGRRAQTGVYLVFASNSDGSETIVTKILFVN